ncbi:MAG: ABC transporter ATP-binding protein, partial [Acidimicrobiales bacterium]
VGEAAELLGLDPYLNRKPAALSGGQRQRVAMGRAIVREPAAFLMDEPLSNLDAQLRVEMRLEIARIQRLLGVATVYVTHDQIEARTRGDRVAVMRAGQLQQCDTPQGLYDHPANEFVAGFMGSPPMNLLRASLSVDANAVTVAVGDQQIPVPDSYATSHRLPTEPGAAVVIGVRPEDVEVVRDDTAGTLLARVERREALGAEILVHLSLADAAGASADVVTDEGSVVARPTTLVTKMGPRAQVAVGDALRVRFHPEHLHFFDATTGASLRESHS